jgi:hypothetical protein
LCTLSCFYAGISKVTFNQYGDTASFNDDVYAAYPTVPLQLVGFKICRLDKGKRIVEILPQPTSVDEIKDAIGRGMLILVPLRDIPIAQVTC